jgi:hypothetical protein
MESGSQFRPPPFPDYGSREFRAETQAVVDAKDDLTPEQTRAAEFWAGDEGTALPPASGTRSSCATSSAIHRPSPSPRGCWRC